jgi:hypothetical protein
MIIFNHPARAQIKRMQGILFLQVNAQYPSRLTKVDHDQVLSGASQTLRLPFIPPK